ISFASPLAGEFYASDALAFLGVEFRGPGVYRLAQRLAGLEMRYALFRNLNALARTRVAPDARRAPIHGEAAKAANLDAMPAHQCVTHRVKNRLDGVFGIAVRQLRKAR